MSLKDTKILDININQLVKLIGIGAILPIFLNYLVPLIEKVLSVRKFEYHLSGFLVLLILGLVFYLIYFLSNKLFKEDKLKSNIITLSVILFLIIIFNKIIFPIIICKNCPH
jgi:high-affinity Fe2+/Pb2+ permease